VIPIFNRKNLLFSIQYYEEFYKTRDKYMKEEITSARLSKIWRLSLWVVSG